MLMMKDNPSFKWFEHKIVINVYQFSSHVSTRTVRIPRKKLVLDGPLYATSYAHWNSQVFPAPPGYTVNGSSDWLILFASMPFRVSRRLHVNDIFSLLYTRVNVLLWTLFSTKMCCTHYSLHRLFYQFPYLYEYYYHFPVFIQENSKELLVESTEILLDDFLLIFRKSYVIFSYILINSGTERLHNERHSFSYHSD